MSCGSGFDLNRERSYPTPYQNSPLILFLLMCLDVQKHTPKTKTCFKREYDYIVVGAGTGGSVVAARLAEDSSKSVLLLEAGKSPPLLTELPAAQPFFHGTDVFWNYWTEPQECAGLAQIGRRIPTPTGKSVGGTSALTGEFYLRGNRADFDDWAKLGAKGWDYRSILRYFRKSEGNTDPDIAQNGYHGCCGPMTVGRFPQSSDLTLPLIKAAISQGYPFRDVNGRCQSGFADLQGNIRGGQRVSTAKAYLVPCDGKHNLDILEEAYVTKVLIQNKTAYGVQFDFQGSRCEVRANSEVILSAGALKTPQILMLSGIGPKKTLENFCIPVIKDLPVGKNFYDHGATLVNFYSTLDRPTLVQKLQDVDNIWEYIKYKKGPLAGPSGIIGIALLADNVTAQQLDLPDYQLYFMEAIWGPKVHPQTGLYPEIYDHIFGPYLNKSTVFCCSQDLNPRSRGCVSIRSRNPYDPPAVDPKFYKYKQDVQHVVQGMKTCYRIMESPFMKEFGFKPFETLMPGCDKLENFDLYLECYARSFVVPISHQSGTARMGDLSDPKTVVDSHLRVIGVNGLRVVDASVIPKLPRASIITSVIMIAEKAADMIKGL